MKKSVLTTSVVSKVMFELGSLGIQIADSVLHFNPFLKAANKDESQIVEFISGFLSFFSFFKGFCRFTLRNIFPNMSCPGHRKRSKKKKKSCLLPWPTEMFYFTLLCKSQTTQVFPLLQVCGFVK